MDAIHFERLESFSKDEGQRIEVEVTVSGADVSEIVREFYGIMSRARGAKGGACLSKDELAARIGEENLDDACRDYALNKFAMAVIRELNIDTVLAPGVHVEEAPCPDQPFSFSLNLVPRPDLSLSSEEPVRIAAPCVEVEERDIDNQVAFTAKQFATLVSADHPDLRDGDFAVMDVDMRKNGKTCKDLSGTRRVIEVRRGMLPDSFIDGILGMRAGDIRKVVFELAAQATSDSASPDSYIADVRLWEVRKQESPEIDDAWIAENLPQFETLAGFRSYIRHDLESQKQKVEQQDKVYRVRKALEERLVGSIPDEMYQNAKDSLVSATETKLQSRGKTLGEYCEEHGMDKATFNMNAFMQASELLRQNLALDILAKNKGLIETEKEIQSAKAALPAAIVALSADEFERRGFRRALGEQIRREKAVKWLLDTAVVA